MGTVHPRQQVRYTHDNGYGTPMTIGTIHPRQWVRYTYSNGYGTPSYNGVLHLYPRACRTNLPHRVRAGGFVPSFSVPTLAYVRFSLYICTVLKTT